MPDTTIPAAPEALAERRCGRCLHMFPADADYAMLARVEFWLCGPCHAVLLSPKERAT